MNAHFLVRNQIGGGVDFTTLDVSELLSLLQRGASLDELDAHLNTPLHRACQVTPKGSVIGLMIEEGANASAKNILEITPLHWLFCSGRLKYMSLLIDAGAEVNAQDLYGNTPAHYGSSCLEPWSVKYLASQGMNWNLTNREGYTVLDSFKKENGDLATMHEIKSYGGWFGYDLGRKAA